MIIREKLFTKLCQKPSVINIILYYINILLSILSILHYYIIL